jgi:hypothetical protein
MGYATNRIRRARARPVPSGPDAADQRPASRAKTEPMRAVLRRGAPRQCPGPVPVMGPWPLARRTGALCAERMNGNGNDERRRGSWLFAPLGWAFFLALAMAGLLVIGLASL